MKFIFNGILYEEENLVFDVNNRAMKMGDCIVENFKISNGKILLREEHYFNLMASMRIFRMKIPIEFTQEFFESEIQKVLTENGISNAKIQISVFRNHSINQNLTESKVSYLVEIEKVFDSENYQWYNEDLEIDVFKDFQVNTSFFTQINSHKSEEIIAHAYMQENEYGDLVLLNHEKRMARTLLGSLFIIQENVIKTPNLTEGGIRSVTKNHLIQILKRNPNFSLEEIEILPFELQKADEVFVLVESEGLISFKNNRKKNYENTKTKWVLDELNDAIDLN